MSSNAEEGVIEDLRIQVVLQGASSEYRGCILTCCVNGTSGWDVMMHVEREFGQKRAGLQVCEVYEQKPWFRGTVALSMNVKVFSGLSIRQNQRSGKIDERSWL